MTAGLDSSMPWLESALDLRKASVALKGAISADEVDTAHLAVESARLIRLRPGRRAVIEYRIVNGTRRTGGPMMLVAKTRAKGLDRETIRVMQGLLSTGFDAGSDDGVSIPGIAGVIPEWRMWVARRIDGSSVTRRTRDDDAGTVMRRVSDAAWKVHRSPIRASRAHCMRDELATLERALHAASDSRRDLADRIADVRDMSRDIADSAPEGMAGRVHRDFYSDQIIATGDRLFVLDFDLYSEGDFELDVGNFVAHMTEEGVRGAVDRGVADRLRRVVVERALERGASAELIGIYETLTLARHIWISIRIPERRQFTEAVLAECERRFEMAGRRIYQ